MHRPRLLLLDEPTNGLDPEGIIEVRQLLMDWAREGCTIFLSSHILGEIAKMAHRIGIIHEGKLVNELTEQELNNQLIKKLIVNTSDNQKALQVLRQAQYDSTLTAAQEIAITSAEALSHPEKISKLLVEYGLPPAKLYLSIEDLEVFFLRSIRHQGK
ncbi:MAG: hypothetical protein SH818_19545 [Saprospiraceae bacterium]|nr:hypothetical protein [Saprospiraceae bacterium]